MGHLLDDVITELGSKRFADSADRHREGYVLEGLNHATSAKPTEFTTIACAAILGLNFCHFLKVGTSLEQGIDRVYLGLAFCHLLVGSVLREQFEDVLSMNIIAVTNRVDADHVDTVGRLERL